MRCGMNTFQVNADLSSSGILNHATLKTHSIAAQLSLLLNDGDGDRFHTNHSELISIIYGLQQEVEQVEQMIVRMYDVKNAEMKS